MMVKIDFSAIADIGKKPQGLILTLVVNWLVKPFTMALLGWLFFKGLFVDWVDPQTASEYIAGMILLGVAPCTAMVFVWSQLTKGDANYTLVQVSVNDLIMIFAFALQAETIIASPQAIVLIAIPLLIQTYGIFIITYWLTKRIKLPHNIAAPACMISTSNFFELAVAVAISLFGLHSGAALATVVGVLVEVPVMLSLVAFANKTRHWFDT